MVNPKALNCSKCFVAGDFFLHSDLFDVTEKGYSFFGHQIHRNPTHVVSKMLIYEGQPIRKMLAYRDGDLKGMACLISKMD